MLGDQHIPLFVYIRLNNTRFNLHGSSAVEFQCSSTLHADSRGTTPFSPVLGIHAQAVLRFAKHRTTPLADRPCSTSSSHVPKHGLPTEHERVPNEDVPKACVAQVGLYAGSKTSNIQATDKTSIGKRTRRRLHFTPRNGSIARTWHHQSCSNFEAMSG